MPAPAATAAYCSAASFASSRRPSSRRAVRRPPAACGHAPDAELHRCEGRLELRESAGVVAANALVLASSVVQHGHPGRVLLRHRLDALERATNAREVVHEGIGDELAEEVSPVAHRASSRLYLQERDLLLVTLGFLHVALPHAADHPIRAALDS